MTALQALSLLPFVPSGSRYEETRHLFAELGFQELWENSGYAGFRNGEAQFILQRFEEKLPDLDAWWQEVSAKELDRKYPGLRFSPPTDYPWGREVNFIDLAGVCWHVGQPGG